MGTTKFASTAVRVVSFDAMNTMIGMREPINVVYSRTADKFGLKVDPSKISAAFPTYIKKLSESHPCFGFNSIGHIEWWRRIVQGCLQEAFASRVPEQRIDKIADRLFNFYASADAWHILDPALKEVIESLRQRGIGAVVISNFDGRLRRILQDLELYPLFDIVVASGEVGVEKPSPRIFEIVAKHCGLSSASELLHIGDCAKKDYKGATDFGAKAILFDPSSSDSDIPCDHKITSFSQLKVEQCL